MTSHFLMTRHDQFYCTPDLHSDYASVCGGLGRGGEITQCLALTRGIKKNPAGDNDLLSL